MATWSGLWNYVYDDGYAGTAGMLGINPRRRLRISQRNYHMPYNRIIAALVQGVGNVFGQYERVAVQDVNDPFGTLGGKRPIELKTVINRPPTTNANDPTSDKFHVLADLYNQKWANAKTTGVQGIRTWPADKSGNGSGGLASSKGL